MSRLRLLYCGTPTFYGKALHVQLDSEMPIIVPTLLGDISPARVHFPIARVASFNKISITSYTVKTRSLSSNSLGNLSDEDDEVCPVECVKEFRSDEELYKILEKAKDTNALVVVDFYKTACGSCKYIEQGFAKLCRGSGSKDAPVIFLKHNVIDEYDEPSETSERLRIKAVPLFHFYKNGILLESFDTRDKQRIDAAILKHISPPSPQEP
ncbi:unnamed protein product [Rhodiola kirilowii]